MPSLHYNPMPLKSQLFHIYLNIKYSVCQYNSSIWITGHSLIDETVICGSTLNPLKTNCTQPSTKGGWTSAQQSFVWRVVPGPDCDVTRQHVNTHSGHAWGFAERIPKTVLISGSCLVMMNIPFNYCLTLDVVQTDKAILGLANNSKLSLICVEQESRLSVWPWTSVSWMEGSSCVLSESDARSPVNPELNLFTRLEICVVSTCMGSVQYSS